MVRLATTDRKISELSEEQNKMAKEQKKPQSQTASQVSESKEIPDAEKTYKRVELLLSQV